MASLPKRADAQTRTFREDNNWLNKQAKRRHTTAAVIVHELVQFARETGSN